MFLPVSYSGKLFRRYLFAPGHPAKIRIQNLLGRKVFKNGLRLQNKEGIRFSLDANDWITRMILLQGNYEMGSISLANRLLSKGGAFIDVGANFGLYTCCVSKNKNVSVIAVEPNFMVLPQLLKNIELNNCPNVQVLNTALAYTTEFTSLHLNHQNNLGSASFAAGNKAAFSILSCSLDFVFEKQGLQTAELIKLDIEGNEFDVLQAFSFEKYFVKNFLVEYNQLSTQKLSQLQAFFSVKGFIMKNIYGHPINELNTELPEHNLWFENLNMR